MPNFSHTLQILRFSRKILLFSDIKHNKRQSLYFKFHTATGYLHFVAIFMIFLSLRVLKVPEMLHFQKKIFVRIRHISNIEYYKKTPMLLSFHFAIPLSNFCCLSFFSKSLRVLKLSEKFNISDFKDYKLFCAYVYVFELHSFFFCLFTNIKFFHQVLQSQK